MKHRARPLIRLAAVSFLVSSTVALAAPALGDDQDLQDCSVRQQVEGACLGAVVRAGDDPAEAAVFGALLQGRVSQAEGFFRTHKAGLSDEVRRQITAALAAERRTPGGGADLLSERDRAPGGPITIQADQDDNGACCATTPYLWELGGSSGTTITWGYYNANGQWVTVGKLNVEMSASIFLEPDVAFYSRYAVASGPGVYFSKNEVLMRRDINNATDSTIKSFSCSTGSAPISCNSTRTTPLTTGYYYYTRNRFTFKASGYPEFSAEYQSRRWVTKSGSTWPVFPAYELYGG